VQFVIFKNYISIIDIESFESDTDFKIFWKASSLVVARRGAVS